MPRMGEGPVDTVDEDDDEDDEDDVSVDGEWIMDNMPNQVERSRRKVQR